MFGDETIGKVKEYLKQQLNTNDNFELRTNFPSRTYNNDETLCDAKLIPNAILFIHKP